MLLIAFNDDVCNLYYCKNDANRYTQITIDTKEYKIEPALNDEGGFIGFFDWLRPKSGEIVGVRMSFFNNEQSFGKILNFPYMKSTFEGQSFELLFKGDSYDESNSGDQDFGKNYIYKTNQNELLLTFNLDFLNDFELINLTLMCGIVPSENLK
jgi:hypothetical protein